MLVVRLWSLVIPEKNVFSFLLKGLIFNYLSWTFSDVLGSFQSFYIHLYVDANPCARAAVTSAQGQLLQYASVDATA